MANGKWTAELKVKFLEALRESVDGADIVSRRDAIKFAQANGFRDATCSSSRTGSIWRTSSGP